MKRVFPPMNDRPEAFMPFATLAYWIFAFVLIPLFLPMIGDGLWGDHKFSSWLDFVYHAINALAVGLMLKTYFVDSFLNVQLDTGKFFNTVGVALSLMLPLAGALYFFRVPVVNVALMISGIFFSNCATTILWSVYCNSLKDTGVVSGATGFLDFVSYMAAGISSTLFANAVKTIGWGNLILIWAMLLSEDFINVLINSADGMI